MKAVNIIVKIVVALAAIAGIVYLVATYGDRIVAWCKKMLGKLGCFCSDCDCECPCDCEGDCENCDCEGDCEECDCDCCCSCEDYDDELTEEILEDEPAEAPAEEVPASEETAVTADDHEFEG